MLYIQKQSPVDLRASIRDSLVQAVSEIEENKAALTRFAEHSYALSQSPAMADPDARSAVMAYAGETKYALDQLEWQKAMILRSLGR